MEEQQVQQSTEQQIGQQVDDNQIGEEQIVEQQRKSQISVDKAAEKRFVRKRYIIASIVAVVMLVGIALINGTFSELNTKMYPDILNSTAWLMRKLSDTFVTVGILFICCAGLMFCSRNGAYDSLSFGVRQALEIMFKKPEQMKYKTLYEYKEAKSKRRPEYKYMLWIGLVIFAIGLVLWGVFALVNK